MSSSSDTEPMVTTKAMCNSTDPALPGGLPEAIATDSEKQTEQMCAGGVASTPESTPTSQSTYPKPPYADCHEVWHIFDAPITRYCAFRAMERDGRIFKAITHKVDGLRYIYWHPEKNGIEIWHQMDDVASWANTIRMLDERFVYTCLRYRPRPNGTDIDNDKGNDKDEDGDMRRVCSNNQSGDDDDDEEGAGDNNRHGTTNKLPSPSAAVVSDDNDYDIVTAAPAPGDSAGAASVSLHTPAETIGEEGPTETSPTVVEEAGLSSLECQTKWAKHALGVFKESTKYKMLFGVPDFTGLAPAWLLTPALTAAMDSILSTYTLQTGETVLYDDRSCALVWIRRDGSSYEIRTNNHYALEYAQRFIVHKLYTVLTTWQLDLRTLPPNVPYWVSAYKMWHERQQVQKHNRRRQLKAPYKKRSSRKPNKKAPGNGN